jgi:hypothetical protein
VTSPFVPRRRGKKEGIFGRAESAHAIHTGGKICKKMAGQVALLVLANFWKRSSRDFLSGFEAQPDQNVSRETFWYDWLWKGSYLRKARKLFFGLNLLSGSGSGPFVPRWCAEK